MDIFLTRRERFSSAHRLFRSELTDSENYEAYGKCANPNWHGHNYELFVTIKGKMNEKTGYVVDLKALSYLIKENVIEKLDHKNINIEVEFMKGRIASTENLAISIWEVLDSNIKKMGVQLHCIKITETENNYVEYFGK